VAAAVLAGALALGLSACVAEPSAGEARRDPAPSFGDARTTQVDAEGDAWTTAGVTVDVPARAVAAKVANVTVGAEIGIADSGIARETFGVPVRVESAATLDVPATITWDVSALDPALRSTAVLVRWDDDRRVWRPAEEAVTSAADATLAAEVDRSGIVTWAAGALGAAVATPDPVAPECDSARLPGWVAVFADPDRDRDDATLQACAENAEGGLTVHASSASAVSRVLEAPEEAGWDWAKRDHADGRFWDIAAGLIDDERTMLLPPAATIDLGFTPPADPSVPYRAVARVDGRTASMDLLGAFARDVSLGEVADPSVAAVVTALYECATGDPAAGDAVADPVTVAALGTALGACATGLADSDLAARLADTAREGDDEAAVQGARAAAGALRLAGTGRFDALAASAAERLVAAAAQPTGGASFTVLADREAPPLGSWTPTCTDPQADAAALFAELAVQPAFVDVSRDVAADPRWFDAATDALAPIAGCTPDQQADLALHLPGEWTDPAAAEVVVAALDGLGLSLMTCDDLFAAVQPVADGFAPMTGITAGTGQIACGWQRDASSVQVWVSREAVDADGVTTRRGEVEKLPDNGLQVSAPVAAAGGYLTGAYVPAGLELEAWLPGYRIMLTTTSTDEPEQWRLREGVAAAEALVAAVSG